MPLALKSSLISEYGLDRFRVDLVVVVLSCSLELYEELVDDATEVNDDDDILDLVVVLAACFVPTLPAIIERFIYIVLYSYVFICTNH